MHGHFCLSGPVKDGGEGRKTRRRRGGVLLAGHLKCSVSSSLHLCQRLYMAQVHPERAVNVKERQEKKERERIVN